MVLEENNRVKCIKQLYSKKLKTFQKINSSKLEKECQKQLKHRQSQLRNLQEREIKLIEKVQETVKIDKNIYIPRNGTLHNFSIHLIPPLNIPFKKSNAYISLSESDEKFTSGRPISIFSKLYFFNSRYDKKTRTFTGVIYFPEEFKGVDRMEFTIVFSEDLECSTGGHIILKKSNGRVCGREVLPHGHYKLMQ